MPSYSGLGNVQNFSLSEVPLIAAGGIKWLSYCIGAPWCLLVLTSCCYFDHQVHGLDWALSQGVAPPEYALCKPIASEQVKLKKANRDISRKRKSAQRVVSIFLFLSELQGVFIDFDSDGEAPRVAQTSQWPCLLGQRTCRLATSST